MAVGSGKLLKTEWDDRFFVRVYELRRGGQDSKRSVAHILGVHHETFRRWLKDKPALMDAWNRGEEARGAAEGFSFRDYVFSQLPTPLQKVWRRIEALDGQDDSALKIEEATRNCGKTGKQRLFLHALVQAGFNRSEALRKCNIATSTYKRWLADPEFAELAEEIEWHRNNYFEDALTWLATVKRDPAAVIYVNRTRNADRGYAEKKQVDVNVSGHIDHSHAVIDFNKIIDQLSIDARKEVLAAFRTHQTETGGPVLPGMLRQITVTDAQEDEEEVA